MRTNTLRLLLIFLFSVNLSSCTEEIIYQNNIDFESGKWPAEYDAEFEFNVEDTSTSYNLAYSLRNSLDYPYSNLYLKYQLLDSIGNKIDERLQELIIMDPITGEPLGSGFSKMYDHQFISVRDYKFENAGTYYFKVFHFMRHDTLPEVYSIGLKVIQNE